jgi:hypothetical protein
MEGAVAASWLMLDYCLVSCSDEEQGRKLTSLRDDEIVGVSCM